MPTLSPVTPWVPGDVTSSLLNSQNYLITELQNALKAAVEPVLLTTTNTSAITLASGSYGAATLTANTAGVNRNFGGWIHTSPSNSVTVPVAGWYSIQIRAFWAGIGGGLRSFVIATNSGLTTQIAAIESGPSARMSIGTECFLPAGNVWLGALHDSGSPTQISQLYTSWRLINREVW